MTVLFIILKTAGIVLLSLLAAAALTAVLILFYPCFYGGEAAYAEKEYTVDFTAWWLFSKFVLKLNSSGDRELRIILPFGINSPKAKEKREKRKRLKGLKANKKKPGKERSQRKSALKQEDGGKSPVNKEQKGQAQPYKAQPRKETAQSQTETAKPQAEAKNNSPRTFPENKEKGDGIVKKINTAAAAVKKAAATPRRAYEFAAEKYGEGVAFDEKYDIKAVASRTFEFFKKFFYGLGLKYFQFYGIIGLEDPADTGMALGAINTISAFIPFRVDVSGNFNEKQLDIDLRLKGRTSLFSLLYPICRYVLSKSIYPIVKEYSRKL